MKRRSFLKVASLGAASQGLTPPAGAASAPSSSGSARSRRQGSPTPVKSILSFATEAAHAPEDYDFMKAIAQFLTAENLVGNFHLTGDYARALKRHGRLDVVEALKHHEIGFHCNHHGSRPWMAGYLEKLPWDEGLSRWLGFEAPGFALVGELFDRRPVYYTTEFSRAPQTSVGSALMGAGTMGYLDVPTRSHSAVWYCNCLVPTVENIVALESFHGPGDREKAAKDRLDASRKKQEASKKDVLRIFLHSYKYYAAAPYDRLTMTNEIYKNDDYYFEDYPTDALRQPPAQFKASFEMFKRSIRHHARNSEFITFSEYRDEYMPNAGVWIDLLEVDRVCRHLTSSLDAYSTHSISLSPAEAFGIVVRVLRTWRETGKLPGNVFVRKLIGPHAPIPAGLADRAVKPEALLEAVAKIDRELDLSGALPTNVNVGGAPVGPGQLLRGLIAVYQGIRSDERRETVALNGPNLPEIAKEAYFQTKGFTRKGLYPDDFTGANTCALALVQSWSWKPAVRRPA
jgi:hypothetical protein